MDKYLKFPSFYFFCLYSILMIIFVVLANYILYDDTLYYKSFQEVLRIDRIAKIIEQQKYFQKIGYAFIPVMILIRTFYTSMCLSVGSFLLNQNLTLKQCFNISLKADIIFLLELIVKINYFSIFEADSLLEINIHLFSVLQLLGVNNIESWMSYPLGILNVFELIYWILLAAFFADIVKKSFGVSFRFVAVTYGTGLLLWIVFVMFIVLNLF